MSEDNVWHKGELAIQKRVGSYQKMQTVGPKVLRNYLLPQHSEFFSELQQVFVAARDVKGKLWASAFYGEKGFLSSSKENGLTMRLRNISPCDPLYGALQAGKDIALLGLMYENRRRNRLNARIRTNQEGKGEIGKQEKGKGQRAEQKLELEIKQSFGNCPKYIPIQAKSPNSNYGQFKRRQFSALDRELINFLSSTHSYFIASAYKGDPEETAGKIPRYQGPDISHRGGAIKVLNHRQLVLPDYSGNNFFNTLGNLYLDSGCALLFIDFANGHHLHLRGRAQPGWAEEKTLHFTGLARELTFNIEEGCLVENASALLYRPL